MRNYNLFSPLSILITWINGLFAGLLLYLIALGDESLIFVTGGIFFIISLGLLALAMYYDECIGRLKNE